jgi:hypothetical protein
MILYFLEKVAPRNNHRLRAGILFIISEYNREHYDAEEGREQQ